MTAVIVKREADKVGVVRLNRPDSLNAINLEIIEELHAAVDELGADRAVRVVVLTGEGAGFCSGLDLTEGHFSMPGTEDMTEVPRQMALQVAIVSLLEKIHQSPKPFIAAINGAAVGGGLALALACDIRLAGAAARFGSVFIKVGASNTDLGISYFLPRIVGAGRSAELLLSGRLVDAAEADRIGLVSAVAPTDELLGRAIGMAEGIAAGGAFQLWMTKETMWQNLDAPSLHHAILTENRTQIMASMTGDVEEAFAAFRKGALPCGARCSPAHRPMIEERSPTMGPMDVELNLGMFLDHAVRHAGDVEIVTREPSGVVRRYTNEAFGRRTNQLMHALDRLGLEPGDTVATLAWNHDRHLEVYFAVPCSGRVLHTLNPRLAPDDLAYTVHKADDRAVFVDPEFVPVLARIPHALGAVKIVVVMGSADAVADAGGLPCPVVGYDDLIADESESYDRPEIPERSPCGICFTTGTTGRPKGVVYTHRSSYLHAMGIASGAGAAIGPGDCVCAQVPMFHANCFGLPHAAMAVGAKQVLSSGPFDPSALVDLMIGERVTFSAGVVTIWQLVADDLRKRGLRLPDLRHLLTAGTRPPASLIETYFTEFGIPMIQAFGMTEASPLAGVAWPKHHMRDWDVATLQERVRGQAALPLAGVAARLRDDDGNPVPWDGHSMGHLLLRGPFINGGYLGADVAVDQFTDDGWFATGDVAVGSPDGYWVIADRTKDLVKSGGEWISSVDMENAIIAMPSVGEAAVIAVPDVKWGERPLPCVVPASGAQLDVEAVRNHLEATGFPRWQLPDRIEILTALPRTSVGKIDKKALRAGFGEH